jgi:hypothetical protein
LIASKLSFDFIFRFLGEASLTPEWRGRWAGYLEQWHTQIVEEERRKLQLFHNVTPEDLNSFTLELNLNNANRKKSLRLAFSAVSSFSLFSKKVFCHFRLLHSHTFTVGGRLRW